MLHSACIPLYHLSCGYADLLVVLLPSEQFAYYAASVRVTTQWYPEKSLKWHVIMSSWVAGCMRLDAVVELRPAYAGNLGTTHRPPNPRKRGTHPIGKKTNVNNRLLDRSCFFLRLHVMGLS